jgi:hypothetical protein
MFSTGKGKELAWFANSNEWQWNGVYRYFMNGVPNDVLSLVGAGLIGTIPDDVGLWTTLSGLEVADNQLVGSLPSSIGLWTGLTDFNIMSNKLTGTVPASISAWTSIADVWMSYNNLNGTMPIMGNNYCGGGNFWADCAAPAKIVCGCCNMCT